MCSGKFKGKGTQSVQGGQDAGIRSRAGGQQRNMCVSRIEYVTWHRRMTTIWAYNPRFENKNGNKNEDKDKKK
jgi:hypothetical protein